MTHISIHNPYNEHTKNNRNYNRFFDEFIKFLQKKFVVETNRYSINAHSARIKVNLEKGKSNDFFLLECECVIENLETGEFVVLSVSDDLTHAILNEKDNFYLKKVLVAQFDSAKILHHTHNNFYKYQPWTYFQSKFDDLDFFWEKKKTVEAVNDKLYFRGTSLQDRTILEYIDKTLITDLSPINSTDYFNEILTHKIALSVDGRGEFCYRDVECFGIGVPILRFEYLSKMSPELIPNYHYISVPRPHDMQLYRTGTKEHAKLLECRYLEVVNDHEFLSFISNNARHYYEKNLTIKKKIINTYIQLGIESWRN